MSEQKPTFDFTRVSRQWSKALSKTIQAATRAQLTMAKPVPSDPTAYAEHALAVNEALDYLDNLSDEQGKLVVQVLVDVPREWLLKGAPDQIDWSKYESLDYIQEPRYTELLQMIASGEAKRQDEASTAAKN